MSTVPPASTEQMETEEDDFSGQLGANRRYNPKVKEAAYTYIFHMVHAVTSCAGLSWVDVLKLDLDANGRIEGAVSTLHNQLRKEANGHAMDPAKFKTLVAHISGPNNCNMGEAYDSFKKNCKDRIDYLTVCPIVNMLTSFKLVKDEVRVGVTQIVPKKGMKSKTVSVSTYGLSAHHAPYLRLITLKPERRSGLMMCIGSLAHCINLLEDKQYPAKSARALREGIKHLPMKEAIVECCSRNTKASIGGVLGALGDVLLLTTDRTHCKMTIPILSFMAAYTEVKEKKIITDFATASKNFDNSGKGAVVFYRQFIAGKNFTWLSDETVTAKSSQIFFHACWGTHFEDLGILAKITDASTWHKRQDMSNVFLKKNAKTVTFAAPSFTLVSKLVSACGTKMLGTVQPMVQCKPCFSGKRKRVFSEELMSVLNNSSTGAYDSSPLSLTKALIDLKNDIKKQNLDTSFGTTQWYLATTTSVEDWGDEYDQEVAETGEYFFS